VPLTLHIGIPILIYNKIYNNAFLVVPAHPGLERLSIIETEDIIESVGGISWHLIVIVTKIRCTRRMSHPQVAGERLD
jgi:hypothetical protein